jgi:hypothetical protein
MKEIKKKKSVFLGRGYSSGLELLLSMCEALGWITSTENKTKQKKKISFLIFIPQLSQYNSKMC